MLISHTYRKSDSKAALVVLVHGRSGTYQVMQTFKSIIPESATVVSVQAPLNDPEGGFRWWDFNVALGISGNSHSNAVVAAQEFVDWLKTYIDSENIEPAIILGIGFSQGAALLSCAIQLEPSLFHGIAMLAGFVVKTSLPQQGLVEQTKILMAHGSNDEIVPLSLAEDTRDFFQSRGHMASFVTDPVGHKIGVEGMKKLKLWLIELISR